MENSPVKMDQRVGETSVNRGEPFGWSQANTAEGADTGFRTTFGGSCLILGAEYPE